LSNMDWDTFTLKHVTVFQTYPVTWWHIKNPDLSYTITWEHEIKIASKFPERFKRKNGQIRKLNLSNSSQVISGVGME
jgi:hypothetical protein